MISKLKRMHIDREEGDAMTVLIVLSGQIDSIASCENSHRITVMVYLSDPQDCMKCPECTEGSQNRPF